MAKEIDDIKFWRYFCFAKMMTKYAPIVKGIARHLTDPKLDTMNELKLLAP